MTTTGWIFMITSWTVIVSLVVFCYHKTLAIQDKKKKEK